MYKYNFLNHFKLKTLIEKDINYSKLTHFTLIILNNQLLNPQHEEKSLRSQEYSGHCNLIIQSGHSGNDRQDAQGDLKSADPGASGSKVMLAEAERFHTKTHVGKMKFGAFD